MLIPKVLKERQDPSRTAEGKVAVTAYHDLTLIQPLDTPVPVTCLSVPICSGREYPDFTDFTDYKVICLACVV